MSKKSHHFLTLWPWPLTYDLEKLIRSGHYHYQCVYQIWEQSIPWFLSYRVNTIAGGGRLRRKTITSPDPSDTGDIIIGHLFYTTSSFVHYFKSIGEFKLELQSGNAQLGSKSAFFVLCDLEIWWKTLENNRATLLYYIKFCASFRSHGWIQTGITVRKRSIRIKIGNFLSCVTLKFDKWPWKTIGHLFYVASSLVHYSIAISEFKLELQSGNA